MPALETVDLAVIGAGPAGLAAALAAAERGLRVALLDERPLAGGQYLLPAQARGGALTESERLGGELLRRLETGQVDRRPGVTVWNVTSALSLGLLENGRASTLAAGAIVLASGAREQVAPFPGWTLPGVMTAGAAQLLAKRHGVLPGKRVLVAGSGPLLLAVAAKLSALGATVVAVLEAAPPAQWLKRAPAAWGQGSRLAEGWRYLSELRKAGVPYRFGRAVVAAHGAERVEAATVALLDAAGRPLREGRSIVAIDTLCVSFGFTPNVELAQLAGAAMVFDPARGGWAPQVDDNLESSAPGLFVAGETAGVGGAALALLTGRIAGLAAARRLGALSQGDLERAKAGLAGRRTREVRFAAMLNAVCAPPAGLSQITTDDTIVCRCEEVTAGELRAAVRQSAGSVTLDQLKVWTRIGQGPCQGRTCGPIAARLIAAEAGCSQEAAGAFAARLPARPLPLGALAALETVGGAA